MSVQSQTKAYFLSVPAKLRSLSADDQPRWGSMSLQHMVEHVVGSWRISNGRTRVKPLLSDEETKQRRAFMFSDTPYPQNLANPMFKEGLPPLRKASLEAAIEQLEDEINAFFNYHDSHPDALETHPIYGALDFDGWMTFQTKHMGHHLKQFGL